MRVRDMTRGSATRLILSTALPLMLGNMFQQLYTIVDAGVVGRGIGLRALAALGSADWFIWLFFSIALGFAQGFSIPVAQAFGAKDYVELRRVAGNALFLEMLTTMAITVIALLAISPVLHLMGTPDAGGSLEPVRAGRRCDGCVSRRFQVEGEKIEYILFIINAKDNGLAGHGKTSFHFTSVYCVC